MADFLEGMGGLGKTALAKALLRRVIVQAEPVVTVGWVTARQAHYELAGAIHDNSMTELG